jgi:hypothetical protein
MTFGQRVYWSFYGNANFAYIANDYEYVNKDATEPLQIKSGSSGGVGIIGNVFEVNFKNLAIGGGLNLNKIAHELSVTTKIHNYLNNFEFKDYSLKIDAFSISAPLFVGYYFYRKDETRFYLKLGLDFNLWNTNPKVFDNIYDAPDLETDNHVIYLNDFNKIISRAGMFNYTFFRFGMEKRNAYNMIDSYGIGIGKSLASNDMYNPIYISLYWGMKDFLGRKRTSSKVYIHKF